MSSTGKSRFMKLCLYTGYGFFIMQTLWMLVLYTSWTLESGVLEQYVQTFGTSTQEQTVDVALPEFIRQPLAAIVVASVILLTIYFLLRTPSQAAHVTIRTAESTTNKVTPHYEKARHIPVRHRKKTKRRVLFFVQLASSLVIFALTIVASFFVFGLASETVRWVGAILYLCSTICFITHFGLSILWPASHKPGHK